MHSKYSLQHGDCIQLLQSLPDHSVDLVLTDPPFGCTKADWDKPLDLSALWAQLRRVLKKTGTVLLFGYEGFTVDLINSNRDWYRYRYVWVKSRPSRFMDYKVRPMPKFEDIVVFMGGGIKSAWFYPERTFGHKPYKTVRSTSKVSGLWEFNDKETAGAIRISDGTDGGRYPTTVLEYGVVSSSRRRHPTEKPAGLLQQLIKCHCPPEGTVLDFCMGSGSTGIAAAVCGRRFIGMELNDHFYHEACKVLKETHAQLNPPLIKDTLSMDNTFNVSM